MNRFRHALVSGTGALCFVASTLAVATPISTSSAALASSGHTFDSSPTDTSLGVTAWLDALPPSAVNFRSMSNSSAWKASAPRKANRVGANQAPSNPTGATTPLWENQAENSLIVDVLKQQHRLTSTSTRVGEHESHSNVTVRVQSASNPLTRPWKQGSSRRDTSRQPEDKANASFVADVPADLIPVYKAAGSRFNIPWTVLAAIHKTETDFDTAHCPVSSAGAEGPMQFEPSTFEAYAVKAPGHAGSPNIQNVGDAIYTAANMLAKKGFSNNPSQAIFAYNHSKWYVKRIKTLAGI